MARPRKLTEKQVVDALKQSHGLKTGAAEILSVNWETIHDYAARSEEAQAVIAFWRMRRTERALYKLDEAIERGENWAIAMQLKDNKDGRQLGYGNTLDVTSDGKAIGWKEFIGGGNPDPKPSSN
jgi:hypothetical protein